MKLESHTPLPPVPKPNMAVLPTPPVPPSSASVPSTTFKKSTIILFFAYAFLLTRILSLVGLGTSWFSYGFGLLSIISVLIFSLPSLGVIFSKTPGLYKICSILLFIEIIGTILFIVIIGSAFGNSFFSQISRYFTSAQGTNYTELSFSPSEYQSNLDETAKFKPSPGKYVFSIDGRVSEGLVGYWSLVNESDLKDGSVITNAFFSEVKDSNGVLQSNGFLNFNGWDSRVEIPSSSKLSFKNGSNITLGAWVRPHALNPYNEIIVKDRTTGELVANYALRAGAGPGMERRLEFYYSRDNGVWEEYVSENDVFTEDSWTNVAATYTFGKGDSIKLYVNGNLIPGSWRSNNSGNPSPKLINAPLWIGSLKDSHSGYGFNGIISDVSIYNRILNQSEIKQNMRAVLPDGTY